MVAAAGFVEVSVKTAPVSREYEEKWGGSLTIGEYILSAKVQGRKPPIAGQ